MKQKQKPLSFSLNPLNIEYIESVVMKQKEVNSRYSRSMYMDDLITHLRTKAANKSLPAVVEKPTNKRKVFKPPTVEEVFNYCNERCNNVDAQSFVDHYTANGWVQGKGKPIKCWKACVRTWEKSDKPKQNNVLNESHEGKW